MANRSFEVVFTGWVASNPVIYRSDPTQPDRAVACFRAMHTPRYRDAAGQWRDGESMRVTVKCWGWAAQYVQKSIHLGDPIIAVGRLNRTRWVDTEGVEHFGMELTASSLGHDLTLGEATFVRMRAGKPKENTQSAEINPITGEIYGTSSAEVPEPSHTSDTKMTDAGGASSSKRTGSDRGSEVAASLVADIDAATQSAEIDYVLTEEQAGVPVI